MGGKKNLFTLYFLLKKIFLKSLGPLPQMLSPYFVGARVPQKLIQRHKKRVWVSAKKE